jgi:hypothetical protein
VAGLQEQLGPPRRVGPVGQHQRPYDLTEADDGALLEGDVPQLQLGLDAGGEGGQGGRVHG